MSLPLVNTQAPEKPDRRDDGSLDVHSLFYTLQGEGPFAGRPAVFVRLAGCDLQCPACDTEYTQGRQRVEVPELVERTVATWAGWYHSAPYKTEALMVLTGGEPLRQNCGPFVRAILDEVWGVQIETNGTLFDASLFPGSWTRAALTIVCSPKTPYVHPDLRPFIDAYKYVLSAEAVDDRDGLPTSALGMSSPPARPHSGFNGEVFLQPEDDKDPVKNAANLKATVVSCLKFGYRLSVQMHKLAGLE